MTRQNIKGLIIWLQIYAVALWYIATHWPTIADVQQTVNNPYTLLHCLVLSIVTIALCVPFWDEMIFERPGNWIKKQIGEYWAKPLFACYICATFWWGMLQCIVYGWPWYLCLPAMGVSAVISLMQHD